MGKHSSKSAGDQETLPSQGATAGPRLNLLEGPGRQNAPRRGSALSEESWCEHDAVGGTKKKKKLNGGRSDGRYPTEGSSDLISQKRRGRSVVGNCRGRLDKLLSSYSKDKRSGLQKNHLPAHLWDLQRKRRSVGKRYTEYENSPPSKRQKREGRLLIHSDENRDD